MTTTTKRPLYETEADLEEERFFTDTLCSLWDCDARKLPLRYKMDYALQRGGIIRAFLEVKVRNYTKDYFETYMLSMEKVLAARQFSEFAGVPSILAVKWKDASGFIVLNTLEDFELGFGGRVDRDDSQDMEPVIFIPIKNFKVI
tara:strand:- start:140 stop:574 length:435 start_codon:yes stop_codon:yes gene_type:complete